MLYLSHYTYIMLNKISVSHLPHFLFLLTKMKFKGGILVLSVILLSLSQTESHFVKPWHLCKSKEVTDPPTPCTSLECSGLCGSLYTGGVGICIAEACECLHSCFKERVGPPASRATKPAPDDKTPKMVDWSSPSSKDLIKYSDQISKMALSSSMEHRKPERLSEAASSSSKNHVKPEMRGSKVGWSSAEDLKPDRLSKESLPSSMDRKHQISKVAMASRPSPSSKDELTADRFSKVAFTSLSPINKPHRISNVEPPRQP